MPGIEEQIERFRAVRAELEAAVLPLAHSIDGRTFEWQAPMRDGALPVGGYALLETPTARRLGQVLEAEVRRVDATELSGAPDEAGAVMRSVVQIRIIAGTGTVLDGDGSPFHDARARPATPDEVRAWAAGGGAPKAPVDVGELSLAPGVPCAIDAAGFDRHTFLCGQSGSGKTYALGVVLEKLLQTGLRLVILDPNSDFARLQQVREGADAGPAERHRAIAAGISVRSAQTEGPQRLHLPVGSLSAEAQAALLRLDPIADREEYAALAALLAGSASALEHIREHEDPDTRRLAQRVDNLGVGRLGIWSRGDPDSVLAQLEDQRVRCLVVDLGSLPTRTEQSLVAEAVLESLWRRRAERSPTLVVIDEAHNICPAEPGDALTALATNHVVRIAAEGRKFGLYLLVSTQRPQKVPENVISQCDNLILMRLNSRADAAFAREVFSFVPPGLLGLAAAFTLGQAIVAGKISPQPAVVRIGARVAEEGGADVPTTWALAPGSTDVPA